MKVTIYSTTTCSFCHALEAWLDDQKVKYTTKITDTDQAAMDEYMKINDGMLGVPFTVIEDDGKVNKIVGFDKPKFKQALALK